MAGKTFELPCVAVDLFQRPGDFYHQRIDVEASYCSDRQLAGSWPSPQDYNEAVQTPLISFADPQLKSGSAQLNNFGVPIPVSGAFASVYRFTSGDSTWAVRCFLQKVADQERRYDAISNFIRQDSLDATVSFDLLKEGIRVRADWYPLLKMEWVEGKTLNLHVEQVANNKQAMAVLAESFKSLCRQLAEVGIAHGDLQHGNIMVSKNGLRLVDYDGMFVPALHGLPSNELGHRNYQHPGRKREHFGAYLDNFSAWIIYTSLRALAERPSLWTDLNGGDECLLFRHEDYISPLSSPVFSALEHMNDGELLALSRTIRYLLTQPVESLPPLGSDITLPSTLPPMPVVKPPPKPTPAPSEQDTHAGARSARGTWGGATHTQTKTAAPHLVVGGQQRSATGKRQQPAAFVLPPGSYASKAIRAMTPSPSYRKLIASAAMAGAIWLSPFLLRLVVHTPPLQEQKAMARFKQGVEWAKQQQYDRAIVSYTDATALNRQFFQAYSNKSGAEIETGAYQQALADAKRAISINPKYAYAWYNAGTAERLLGRFNEAMSNYTQALVIDKRMAEAYLGAALAERSVGHWQNVIYYLDRYLNLKTRDGEAYFARAWAYDQLKEYSKAAEDFTRGLSFVNSQPALWNRALSYFYGKDYKNALADLTTIINNANTDVPRLVEAYKLRSQVNRKLGNTQAAAEDLKVWKYFKQET